MVVAVSPRGVKSTPAPSEKDSIYTSTTTPEDAPAGIHSRLTTKGELVDRKTLANTQPLSAIS